MPYKDKEKYNAYKRRTTAHYSVTVSRVSEQDMIDYLDAHKPCNAYIKNLIRQDMKK